jgi:predicted DNA-binding transcriptional regulator YafY
MTRPTLRVLTVLELLQSRGRIGGAELAQRLDVDRRTVRRYISKLEELGIPITAEHGRDGGYALVAGFKLPPLMFTGDEALALSVGLLASRGLGLGEAAPAVASAQAKLERVMPDKLRRRIGAVNETVTLELSHPAATFDNDVLVVLSGAAQNRVRTRLRYRGQGQGNDTERDFDPYGLIYRAGRWYVVGHCHLRRGLRSFRLDRVISAQALPAWFVRPAAFDALEYLKHSVAMLPRAHAIEVLLKTDMQTARRELFSAFGVLEPLADGILLRSQADDLGWFAQELARLPFEFEIRSPDALGDALRTLARRLQRIARRI